MTSTEQTAKFLNKDKIFSKLKKEILQSMGQLDVFETIGSTNTYLLECAKVNMPTKSVCFSAQQTGGRGRLGRTWLSPQGGIYCSFLNYFAEGTALQTLSLATAVIVVRALSSLELAQDITVKWPNDILLHGKKVGGILIESVKTEHGIAVVFGIGLNLTKPAEAWEGLETVKKDVEREIIAAELINAWFAGISAFTATGFESFYEEWSERHFFQGKEIRLQKHNEHVTGIVQGITQNGELILLIDGYKKNFSVGEIG